MKPRLSRRNTFTKKKRLSLKTDAIIQHELATKPRGFWYGINDSWYNYATKSNTENLFLHRYNHEVKLNRNAWTTPNRPDRNRVLFIRNEKDFAEFSSKYGCTTDMILHDGVMTYWKKVASDFAGIEVCKNFTSLHNESLCWYPWDAASGCIWNIKPVNYTHLVYEKKRGEYISVDSPKRFVCAYQYILLLAPSR